MKKLLLMLAVVVVALAGCKTNEANYRAAYEKAKEKRTEPVVPTTPSYPTSLRRKIWHLKA